MIRLTSYDNLKRFAKPEGNFKRTQNRKMTPVKKNNIFSFETRVENLLKLPVYPNEYMSVQWKAINVFKNLKIFPDKFEPDNFNQGNTSLCFLFSSLSSIATIPGLIHKIFRNDLNWRKTREFELFLFHNNQKRTITISDRFPFELKNGLYFWIWSHPAGNELFSKIIEKAYLKYQLTFGKYMAYNQDSSNILSIINKIIHIDGGTEREAMKILINSEFKSLYNIRNNYMFIDHEKIFQDIKNYKNKNALITLARRFNNNSNLGHAYSVLAAWELRRGKTTKKVICVKNPWEFGDNKTENFQLDSLNNSLNDFPELIEFNNKYFFPSKKIYKSNYYDYIVGNNPNKNQSSVFIVPLDYLLKKENGLTQIEVHIPNYKRDFPSVNLELNLYDKLDQLFKMIQSNNVKNIYDSNIKGQKTITRVISIGDKNQREIISNIYNKNCYMITKNGENYFELTKRDDGDYNIINMSNIFNKDYADNTALLTNNKTGEQKIVSLREILSGKKKDYQDYSLTTFNHRVRRTLDYDYKNNMNMVKNNNRIYPINNNFLVDTITTKTLTSFSIVSQKPKPKPKTTSIPRQINYTNRYPPSYPLYKPNNDKIILDVPKYKRIDYTNGYYIGYVFKNRRDGKGKLTYYNGGYEDGIWENDNFVEGKKKIIYSNGIYEGGWNNNCKNGYGIEVVNGVTFKGNFVDGVRHGKFQRICTKGNIHNIEYEYGELKSRCFLF